MKAYKGPVITMELADKQNQKRMSGWLRAAAFLMALLMLCSLMLLDAVKIKIQKQPVEAPDIFSSANNYLVDSTEYVSKPTLERVAQAIQGVLAKPVSLQDYYNLASEAIAKENYQNALTFIDVCLEIAASDEIRVEDAVYVDLNMKKACLLALSGEYDRSLAYFDKVLEKDPSLTQAHQVKIQILIEQGKTDAAITAISGYLSLKPLDFSMRLALIQLYYTQQEFIKAGSACSEYLSLTKLNSAAVYFLRGACRMQTGEFELAKQDMLDAALNNHEDPGLCYGQASICAYLLKQNEAVITYGQKAVDIGSKELDTGLIHSYMGYASMLTQNYETAYGHFTAAMQLGQPKASMLYYRGVSLMAREQPKAAIVEFGAAIAAGEFTSQCYYNRAVCYLKLNDYDSAMYDLNIVAAMDDAELKIAAQELISMLNKA